MGKNYTMTAIRKRYKPLFSLCIFSFKINLPFFSWLHPRVVKLNYILTLFTDSIIESLPEKILLKRIEGARIESEVFEFVEWIYYDGALRLEKPTLARSLPWSTVSPPLIYVVKKSSSVIRCKIRSILWQTNSLARGYFSFLIK